MVFWVLQVRKPADAIYNEMVRWCVSRHSGLVQYGPAGSSMQKMSLVQDLRAMEVVLEFNAGIVTEHIGMKPSV